MKMGIKVLECNLASVNKYVEVKHLKESIDQGPLMYSQNCQWWENLPLRTASVKALKMTLVPVILWLYHHLWLWCELQLCYKLLLWLHKDKLQQRRWCHMVPGLLVVLLAAMLVLFKVRPLSQSMNRTSFPGANHKRDSFCCHVQLTDKMYSTNFLLW